ncbi:unnamed protein product [Linum trigynum]|uniref:Uncharacterized protein n=1 Tax=Linum trigynum TaxID=586398 RepID=A0AAV2F8S5_9ROSI
MPARSRVRRRRGGTSGCGRRSAGARGRAFDWDWFLFLFFVLDMRFGGEGFSTGVPSDSTPSSLRSMDSDPIQVLLIFSLSRTNWWLFVFSLTLSLL